MQERCNLSKHLLVGKVLNLTNPYASAIADAHARQVTNFVAPLASSIGSCPQNISGSLAPSQDHRHGQVLVAHRGSSGVQFLAASSIR